MKTKLTKWDVIEHLKTEDDMAGYLEACRAENDPALIVAALGDIARARLEHAIQSSNDNPGASEN